MSRYRKSIHQALEEVGEWQPPTEPEVLIEEAPIPTETGRELLKKRIAHRKVEKKELKYYPMGDVFRGKLQKTTQHLKEALEIDSELDEAIKWEVKVTGLPVFYSDGKSKGAVRVMLRKLLKHPDDIISITRTTSAELKKIRRGQIAGDEPGDEDEDKNPVGPSYNEEQELDELSPELAKRAYQGARKKRQQIFNKSDETDRIPNVKKQDRQAKKFTAYAAKKESNLPPHLSKFLDKKGNPNKEAQARIDAGRKKRAAAAAKPKITDVTPKGYGPNEEDEMAIMSLDHKEAPRKLKITQDGLNALRAARDKPKPKPKPKTHVHLTKAGRKAIKDEVELDEAGRPRGAAHIENTRFWDLKDKELHYIIKDAGQAVQANPTSKKATQGPGNWSDQINDAATVLYYRKKKKIKVEKFEGPFTAPGSGSIAKQRKAKASDTNKSIEQQVADARQESLAFQEGEWDQMWKNAAHSKPKMSFKQATAFIDEVGLEKKEKTNALKTAKKWLK